MIQLIKRWFPNSILTKSYLTQLYDFLTWLFIITLPNRCLNFSTHWLLFFPESSSSYLVNVIMIYQTSQVKNLESSLIPLFPLPHHHHYYIPIHQQMFLAPHEKYIPHLFTSLYFYCFHPNLSHCSHQPWLL